MRVAFVGKGGSGKTTLAALFCQYLTNLNLRVIAIDADINQNLGEALGLSEDAADAIPQLGNETAALKTILRGCNQRISSEHVMIKTTPPGRGSNFIFPGSSGNLVGELASCWKTRYSKRLC